MTTDPAPFNRLSAILCLNEDEEADPCGKIVLPEWPAKKGIDMDDGGAAFPVPETKNETGKRFPVQNDGMSLRDYYAAAALQGMLSKSPTGFAELKSKDALATAAFEWADAMLNARDA